MIGGIIGFILASLVLSVIKVETKQGSYSGLLFFAWIVFMPLSLGLCIAAVAPGTSLGVRVAGIVCALVWLGAPIAHRIAAPLGRPRLAHTMAAVGAVPFHVDLVAHAALASSRAAIALRNRDNAPPEHHVRRIEAQLRGASTVTGASIAALGFLAIARGETERGRGLLMSVGGFVKASRASRNLAARWLVADAATRGDWPALLTIGETLTTPLTRFTHAVAARFVHQTPTNRQLVALWLGCGSRVATYGLLRTALRYQRVPSAAADTPLLARHVVALRDGGSDDALVDLARAWDAATIPEPARRQIADDLAHLGATRPHLAARHPAFRPTASVEDPQSELEVAIQALHRRHDDERNLPPLDEWAEYVMLRGLYARAATDAVGRRLAYNTAHLIIGNHAVHLLNNLGQRAMGLAMFQWLLQESIANGDEGFIAHYTRNVDAST